MKKPTAKSVEEVNIYLEGLGLGTADNGNLTRDGNLSVERTGGDVMLQVKTISSGNPYINISGAADQYITWQYSSVTKFSVRTTASDWRLYVADDAGSIWSGHTWVFGVNRSTGLITAKNGIAIGDAGPRMMVGTGSPEGAVTAPPGSVWRQTDDSTLTYLRWYKATGTGNTGWLPDFEGRFKTFTPTLKDSTGSTLSGWTCTGRYTIRGKWATCIVDILASSPSAGTGEYRIYLPSDAQAATSSPVRWCVEGSLIAFDNSSGNLGWMRVNVANAAYVTAWSPATWPYSNGQYQLSATVPNFTWAASDRINGTFSYEIA